MKKLIAIVLAGMMWFLNWSQCLAPGEIAGPQRITTSVAMAEVKAEAHSVDTEVSLSKGKERTFLTLEKFAWEPVQEEVTESVQEKVTESVRDEITEPIQEKVTESVQDEVTEPIQEEVTEPIQEEVTESIQEEVAESIQEEVAESIQEEVTEPIQEEVIPYVPFTEEDVLLLGDVMYAEEGVLLQLLDEEAAWRAIKLCGSVVLHRRDDKTKFAFSHVNTVREVIFDPDQYSTSWEVGTGYLSTPQEFYDVARELLTYGPLGPRNLVFQSQFSQWQLYEKIYNQYFCLSSLIEP